MPILKTLKQHRVLLDTHVWLWSLTASPKLSKKFADFFEKNLVKNGFLLSPMSIWEIGMLVDKRRIELEMDVQDWINQALELPGVQLSPITPHIAIQSTRLPQVIHGDPVDRLLIATAHLENAVLVTCDQKILDFGQGKFITVYNPSES